jgi:hypothetical protein
MGGCSARSLSRMNRPEVTLILARAANGVIGADGKMP